jgi:hypothetical protein
MSEHGSRSSVLACCDLSLSSSSLNVDSVTGAAEPASLSICVVVHSACAEALHAHDVADGNISVQEDDAFTTWPWSSCTACSV